MSFRAERRDACRDRTTALTQALRARRCTNVHDAGALRAHAERIRRLARQRRAKPFSKGNHLGMYWLPEAVPKKTAAGELSPNCGRSLCVRAQRACVPLRARSACVNAVLRSRHAWPSLGMTLDR